ncbi:MAG TPA: methyltransferase dimerization domain-containing protein, partial [Terriglobia bacterium]|nr:methyltransferase dimerization domain-containing protein [Terriglobia bacterium]
MVAESAERPDPSIITNLATGYWASMVLIAANKLGLFGKLGDAQFSSAELAEACGVPARGLELLLNACVA